ncbi:uncharacterized protein QO010_003907 [Caulobacter ginsengisoli]|uniref:DUF418 domain-containing protein n=1 Tax=Caulobacter ginsengisoli TaxID=400775 RepID=A0ABU0IVS5_9CAUL|nr:DUF418 domain-containing protein [Caulobacter ginsengisoli]MDQ0466114.1 uncharacterized protein [Caulobacter ginsengisoli]
MDQAIAPTQERDRLGSLDVLRGFALCGILLMNITSMGDLYGWVRPLTPQSLADPSWVVWLVGTLLVSGTMRGLFTLLFGAGVLLITARAMAPDGPVETADVFYRRALMLMVLGVVNFTVLLWPGEILFVYGLCSLFLFPLRKLPAAALIAIGLLSLTIDNADFTLRRYQVAQTVHAGEAAQAGRAAGLALTAADKQAIIDGREAVAGSRPDPELITAETAAKTSGDYFTLLGWSASTWWDDAHEGLLGAVLESMGGMLIGMGLFKLGVLSGRRSLAFYLGLAAVGYAIGISLNGWSAAVRYQAHFYPVNWFTVAAYDPGRIAVTLGHLGLVLALWKAAVLGGVGRTLADMGRMALTNYMAQSLICAVLFYGLGLWGQYDWAGLWAIAAAIWLAQAAFSVLWLRRFAMGPLEWLLRAVAYGHRPVLRRPLEAIDWKPFRRA